MPTVETCKKFIVAYEVALEKVLQNQSYSINGRVFNRADLAEIQKGLKEWYKNLEDALALRAGGRTIVGYKVVFHD